MRNIQKRTLGLLQAVLVVGMLAGCTTPQASTNMMADGQPMCPICMDKMSSGDMPCCKSCCSCCKNMMKDEKTMDECMGKMGEEKDASSAVSKAQPKNKTDHTKHHPAVSE